MERETREGQRGHWALTLSMNRQKDLNPWAPQAGVVEPNLVPEGPRKGKVDVRVEAGGGVAAASASPPGSHQREIFINDPLRCATKRLRACQKRICLILVIIILHNGTMSRAVVDDFLPPPSPHLCPPLPQNRHTDKYP